MRFVLLHYHLFKNAGTSIDAILRSSFKDKWNKYDLEDSGGRISPKMMEDYIRNNPLVSAFSSHHVIPPFINGGNDLKILPIFFLREPIIRARSAYLFECGKQLGLAHPNQSFASYIEEKLSNSGVVANFQTVRLSNQNYNSTKVCKTLSNDKILASAMNLINTTPYFGLVERYRESVIRMHYYMRTTFPEFQINFNKMNVTQKTRNSISEQHDLIRNELGNVLYDELINRNQLDIELYSHAIKVFDFE